MITILIPRHTLTCFSILQTHRSWNLFRSIFFREKKLVARTIRYVASMVLRTLPRLLPRSSQPCTVASTSKETTWGTHRGLDGEFPHGRRWKGWGDGTGKAGDGATVPWLSMFFEIPIMSVETIKSDCRNQFEHLLSLWRSHCAILADLDLEATKIEWISLHCHVSNAVHCCGIL